MFRNYFKTTFRNLWRNKVFSAINIVGLSVGLACCMLIFLYAKDEISFDRFHQNKDLLYHLGEESTSPDGHINKGSSTGPVPGPIFKRRIPEFQDFVRIQSQTYTVRKGTEVFDQDALFVDSNFFSVFTFPMLQGNPATALNNANSVVLSEEVADKYFGKKEALGKLMELKINDTFRTFVVTGVTKKSPQNSTIQIKMLLPMRMSDAVTDNQWLNSYLNTFMLVKPGVNIAAVQKKMESVFNEEAAAQLKEAADKYGYKDKMRFTLQPLLQMHLSTDYPADNGLSGASNPMYAYILTGIALFIMIIACINFVNLTVARSLKRAKEIGIRKAVGGLRSQLIAQFLGESFILSFLSFLFAIVLVIIILPLFNNLANKALAFSYLFDAKLIAGYVGIFLLTGLLAGFYPALVLSGFNPVESLYGKTKFKGKNYLSKGLVVLQFTLATFLIIATVTIYSQFNYLTHYDLGYNDKNVVIVSTNTVHTDKLALLRNELLKNNSIKLVSADQGGRWGTIAHINNGVQTQFDIKHIDENYLPLFQIPIVKGRNFSKDIVSDSAQSVLVNEEFAKQAGWKNPLGQVVDFYYNNKKYNVVGVVKNYNFVSLTEKVGPELFTMKPDYPYNDIYIKLSGDNTPQALNYIQKTFKKMVPFKPYQYVFKDAQNEQQYDSEAKWKQIITFGAGLTIFISCIGLFGLATLAAERRKKEIGIRKVLGASVQTIVTKLSNDFLKLVIISALIAVPAAWFVMNKWLENYPYRIALSAWIFLLAAMLVLVIALITISFQSIKAATANPVVALKNE